MKRASFFTLSGFLLATLVLVLALLFSNALNQSSERLRESGSLDRVLSLERSMGRTISSIETGIKITKEEVSDPPTTLTVTISEKINSSYKDYGHEFYSYLLNLKNYLEAEQSEITLNPDSIFNQNEKIPIILKPHNLRYTHYNYSGNVGIKVITEVANYAYVLNLSLLEETINPLKDIEWIIQNPGNEDLEIIIKAEDYENYSTILYKNISRTETNLFRIEKCDIEFNSYGESSVDIKCDKAIKTDLTITPIFLDELVSLNYPKGLLMINFPKQGIYKNSHLKIT